MNLKHINILGCLMIIGSLLYGCTETGGTNGDVSKQKKVTLLIIEENSKQQNYLVTLLTDGKEMGDIAVLPMVRTMVAKNNRAELEIYPGVSYTLKVHRTNVKSIDDLYKKTKKPSNDKSTAEEKPLVTYVFAGKEDMDEIELKIPSE